MTGDLAVQQRERAAGDAQRLYLILGDHAHDRRVVAVVGADISVHQSGMRQSAHATVGVVADAHGVYDRQASR